MAFRLEDPHPGVATQNLFAMENNYRTSMWAPLAFTRRRALIRLILRAWQSCDLHPRMTYLAINYVDRLIHSQRFPEVDHISFVASTCLSLASQYSDSAGSFTVNDLNEENGFEEFAPDARYRVNLQVRAALNGDMNSITPFAFLDFFLVEHFPAPNGQIISTLKFGASVILFQIQPTAEDILRYKPSVIAASALLCAVQEMFPEHFDDFAAAVRSSQHMDQDVLELCFFEMLEILPDDDDSE